MMLRISSEPSVLSRRAFSTFRILPRSGRIAWNLRSRPCFAEPPAESPSTRYSSHSSGLRSWHSASLPGSPAPSRAPLLRVRSRALRAASRARAASRILRTMRLATDGFSSRKVESFSFTRLSTMPLHLGVAELALRLALELRVWHLGADHGGEAFARVLALHLVGEVLGEAGRGAVGVQRARQGALEAREVRAAVMGVDVVGERVDVLGVAVVPLQRHLDRDLVAHALDHDRSG